MIKALGLELEHHPVYEHVNELLELQVFMECHCFAVWDFMTLLKSLQAKLTCVSTPWIPPQKILSARLINEIVLAEETDEVAPGHYRGHYDLYVEAMGEIGANGTPILELVDRLRKGEEVHAILGDLPIPECVRKFVRTTLELAVGEPHEVAAAFLYGREDIIPTMFQKLLPVIENLELDLGYPCRSFRTYLARHIELDGDHHGPMGQKVLEELCEGSHMRWSQARRAAEKALRARLDLWDGVLLEILSVNNPATQLTRRVNAC